MKTRLDVKWKSSMKSTFYNVSTVNTAEFDSDSVENCLSVFLEQADNHPEAEIREGKPSSISHQSAVFGKSEDSNSVNWLAGGVGVVCATGPAHS